MVPVNARMRLEAVTTVDNKYAMITCSHCTFFENDNYGLKRGEISRSSRELKHSRICITNDNDLDYYSFVSSQLPSIDKTYI